MSTFQLTDAFDYGAEMNKFTHCILVDSSTGVCWMSSFVILGVSGLICPFYSIFDPKSS